MHKKTNPARAKIQNSHCFQRG